MNAHALKRAHQALAVAIEQAKLPPQRFIQDVFGQDTRKRALTHEERSIVMDRALEQGWRPSHMVVSHLEEIDLFADAESVYSERGYSGTMAAIGNWNSVDEYNRETKQREDLPHGDLPERLFKILEKLGFECEWSDEWSTCSDCGRLVRTQPDSYDWRPSYIYGDGDLVCLDCSPEAEEEDTEEEDNAA